MSLLHQPEYIHVLLNHLPLIGLGVALLALIIAMVIRNRAAIYLSLCLIVITAGAAWPVYVYGGKAYDRVYAIADNGGRTALDEHGRLAQRWVPLYYVTAAITLGGLCFSLWQPKCLKAISVVVLLLSALCLIQGFRIAEEGGKIRHREFRP